jgi:anion-transporting  ArsA/GET3 family ATPase
MLKELFKPGAILVIVGTGGVGKTTVAAALGLAAARASSSTGVLTVDPSRRLRDALGIARLEARPRTLDSRRLAAAGLDRRLALAASSLDVKSTWDAMVERYVAEPLLRRQIFANSFYQNLTQRFTGAEAYAALEQLLVMHESGRFAIEVVDTPPAQQAFDFIRAPNDLARLLDSTSAKWLLSWTAGSHRFAPASRMARAAVTQIERFAGLRPLSAIAEFFAIAAHATEALRARMSKADALLRSRAVNFVLVTTAEKNRLREAEAITQQIKAARLRLAAVVINRVSDEETYHALVHAPGAIPPHLRLARALARDSATPLPIAQFLTNYAAGQTDSIRRAASFAREVASDVALVAVPELQHAESELTWLVQFADQLLRHPDDRHLIERAARAFTARK